MTQTLNGHPVTLSGDAQMRVRAPETPVGAADSTPDAQGSAFTPVHARAIPDQLTDDHAHDRSSVRDVVSQHGGDAIHALQQSWLLTEVPMTAGEAWTEALPGAAEYAGKAEWLAKATAGLFRALAVSLLHLFLLAVGTRIRAGAALVLFVLAAAGSCAAHHL